MVRLTCIKRNMKPLNGNKTSICATQYTKLGRNTANYREGAAVQKIKINK